jgi:hypothetical protein
MLVKLITDVKLMETSVPPQTSRQPFPIACETPSSDVIEDANSLSVYYRRDRTKTHGAPALWRARTARATFIDRCTPAVPSRYR